MGRADLPARSPIRTVLKWVAVAVGVLVLLAACAAAWFMSRPPPPAKVYEPGPSGRRVTDAGLFANYFPAVGNGRRPGILLLGGSEGGLARDLLRQASLLQREGFNVLHVAYHSAPGKPATLTNVPLEGFRRGLDWLKAQREVDPASLGVVGYSKGAEAALLIATRYPGIKAVVAGMPSSVAWDGLDPFSILAGMDSSWSEGGREVPSLGYGWYDGERGLYAVFEDGLATLAAHPDTVIPVERFRGRLLLVCGGKDELWPSCPMADQILARATRMGRPATRLLRYPEAGHGVMGAPGAATDPDIRAFSKLGGTTEANAAARADSWPKIVAYLKEAL